MIDYIGYSFSAVGILFTLLAALAFFRFPDVYTRLVAATKCAVLGAVFVLTAVIVMNGFSAVGVKALLCILLLLIIVPVETHILLKAARASGAPLWKGSVIDAYAEEKRS
jgi:multicomponent Na+:H+ antiporter subunit G